MTYLESTTHAAKIAEDGRVWINSKADGSAVGRYNPRTGLDIYTTASEQLEGKPQCLHCTHGQATAEDADHFRAHAQEHWGILLPRLTVLSTQKHHHND
jgi:sugar lactone lactonase YvrE